jgi:outer membrane murein-binding lipoprotein Lpp
VGKTTATELEAKLTEILKEVRSLSARVAQLEDARDAVDLESVPLMHRAQMAGQTQRFIRETAKKIQPPRGR